MFVNIQRTLDNHGLAAAATKTLVRKREFTMYLRGAQLPGAGAQSFRLGAQSPSCRSPSAT